MHNAKFLRVLLSNYSCLLNDCRFYICTRSDNDREWTLNEQCKCGSAVARLKGLNINNRKQEREESKHLQREREREGLQVANISNNDCR